jgi:hypothetical protein
MDNFYPKGRGPLGMWRQVIYSSASTIGFHRAYGHEGAGYRADGLPMVQEATIRGRPGLVKDAPEKPSNRPEGLATRPYFAYKNFVRELMQGV